MTLDAYGPRVLVTDCPSDEVRESGLTVIGEAPQVAVGIVTEQGETDIEPGTKVYYGKSTGYELPHIDGRENVRAVDTNCILAIERNAA